MTGRRQQLLIVGAVLVLGLVLRLCQLFFGVPLDQTVWSDMNNYVQIADMIGNNVWREYHFFQPVGLSFIILLLKQHTPNWGFYLSLFHCLLSFGTLVFLWRTAEEAFGFKIGLISLIMGSIHLPWIYLTTYALPETIFTFLLSVSAWMAARIVKREGLAVVVPAFLWGIFFAGGIWLKGTHALLGPLFLMGLMLYEKRRALIPILALGIPVAAGLTLHGALTYSKIGKVRLTATNSGLNFVEGKCPEKKNRDTAGYTWYSPLYYQLGLKEAKQWDRPFIHAGYYWRQGFACIGEDPFVLVQSLESIPYLFVGNATWPLMFKPNAAKLRLFELLLSLFLICGLAAYWRDSFRSFNVERFLVWDLPILALFLCSYIFKAEVRYRVPFDIWLIPMAVFGWSRLAAAHPSSPAHETP